MLKALLLIGLLWIPFIASAQDSFLIQNKTSLQLKVHFYSPQQSSLIDGTVQIPAHGSQKIALLRARHPLRYGKKYEVFVEIQPVQGTKAPLRIITELQAERKGRQVIFETSLEFPKESSQAKLPLSTSHHLKEINLWDGAYEIHIEKKDSLNLIIEEKRAPKPHPVQKHPTPVNVAFVH